MVKVNFDWLFDGIFSKYMILLYLINTPLIIFIGSLSFITGIDTAQIPISVSLLCFVTIIWTLFRFPFEKLSRSVTLIIITINIPQYIIGLVIG